MKSRNSKISAIIAVVLVSSLFLFGSCSGVTNSVESNQKTESNVSQKSTTTTSSDKSGVMLQGFNWESASRTDSSTWYQWYNTMLGKASDIKDTFEYVWFPPPSATANFGPEGYLPTQLNDLNSYYGTEAQLKATIEAIKPAKAIADIVINHRCGTTDWGDFTNPSWNDNYWSICSDDEGFSGSSLMMASSNRGASDTGEGYSAARDIDHTNYDVQNGIISWMNNVLKGAGFVGWRYDYVKGYSGYYVGKYNAATSAEFSVGEFWPTAGFNPSYSSAWKDELMNWINATSTGGYKTKAFDFVLKGNLNNAFGWGSQTGLWNMALLADSNNIFRQAPEYAVTFIDNHDTGSTQKHWELDAGDLGPAYAFILTHPGYPCVAWQHYFTGSGDQYKGSMSISGTSNNLKSHIDQLISLRKSSGVGYDSSITVANASSTLYAAYITGTNNTVAVKIGGDSWTPTGNYTLVYSGTNFSIWTSGSSTPVDPDDPDDPITSYKLSSTESVGYGKAVYFTGSFDEGASWSTAVRGTWDSSINGWSTTVTGSSFEWKTLTGDYNLGESVSTSTSGLVWASGANKTQADGTPVSGGSTPTTTVTIKATCNVGNGYGVFFTGDFGEANSWSTAVRGTWTSGNVWTATVTVPSSGSFSWKAMKGSYSAGETTSTGTSGMVWESGANHTYPSTSSITVSF